MAQIPLFAGPNDAASLRAYLNTLVNYLNGPTEFRGDLEIDGSLDVDGDVYVAGESTFADDVSFNNQMTIDATVGDVTTNGTINADAGLTVNTTSLTVDSSGNTSIAGTAAIAGQAQTKGVLLTLQGAPTAKTVTGAITAAQLKTGIITTTGATAPSVHQLPTGTLLLAEFPGMATGQAFDFYVINTGTGASDDATITVNTDVTIVGNPTVGALTDGTIVSGSGHFRARYTTGVTWIVYRLS